MKKVFSLFIILVLAIGLMACNEEEVIELPSPAPTESSKENDVVSAEVTFYFPDEAVMYLVPTKINVNTRQSEFIEAIISTLVSGPASKDLNAPISGDVEVLSVQIEDNLCIIDLSDEFAIYNTGGSTKETMAIYSIVNTLCSLEGVDKVKINIEGNENAEFGGHFSLDEPFEPDESLVKK